MQVNNAYWHTTRICTYCIAYTLTVVISSQHRDVDLKVLGGMIFFLTQECLKELWLCFVNLLQCSTVCVQFYTLCFLTFLHSCKVSMIEMVFYGYAKLWGVWKKKTEKEGWLRYKSSQILQMTVNMKLCSGFPQLVSVHPKNIQMEGGYPLLWCSAFSCLLSFQLLQDDKLKQDMN